MNIIFKNQNNYFLFKKVVISLLSASSLFSFFLSPLKVYSYEINSKVLRVGIVDNYMPCSDNENGFLKGYSLDVWRQVQEKIKNYSYKTIVYETFEAAVEAASSGAVDLVASCHTISSSRLKRVGFSVPYTWNTLTVVSKKNSGISINSLYSAISSRTILLSFFLLLIITGLVSVITTLFDRDLTDDADKRRKLIFIFKTWVLLIIGKGTESLAKRKALNIPLVLFAGVSQILLVSILVASFTSESFLQEQALSAEAISRPYLKEIMKEGIAVQNGTEMQRWINGVLKKLDLEDDFKGKGLITTDTADQLVEVLQDNKVNHLLTERTIAKYLIKSKIISNKFKVSLQSEHFYPEAFIFGNNLNLDIRNDINRAIASMNYEGEIRKIMKKYN